MPHRAHLFSLRIANALRESCLAEPYGWSRFSRDLIAGATVGVVAIPLSMALAIATGVAPQYGLYTAIVAGFVIALTGGSRFSVSGPTAAFIVILHPVVVKFGLSGLLVATLMAGALLMGMALLRLGRYIEYIPESVTLGFTSGIAIVILVLQVKDFLGLSVGDLPESFLEKITLLWSALPTLNWPDALTGVVTLSVLIGWPRLKLKWSGHLPAVLAGTLVALGLQMAGAELATIGNRFSFVLADGTVGQGIPPVLPSFDWPWLRDAATGPHWQWNYETVRALLVAALAIAMLGAIESLLCAVVLDNMTGKRHSANSELLGQGIGNLLAPFMGGFTATAALARSATNVRAGAESPVAAMVHALVVLSGLLLFARWLTWLPMASMAAILLMVAWNMSEAHRVRQMLRKAPKGDVLVLLTCLFLTVFFDMVIAIGVGVVLASLLFMRDISGMIRVQDITEQRKWISKPLPADWVALRINGPLFFAAADRVFGEISRLVLQRKGLLLSMDAVSLLDAGGLAALEKLISHCRQRDVQVIVTDLQFQPLKVLKGAGMEPEEGRLRFVPTLDAAVQLLTPAD